jgi:hypothetical protein
VIPPQYDEHGKPLLRSTMDGGVWEIYHSDPFEFKRKVKAYYALGYPGWTVVKANFELKAIWLRDDRRKGP